MSFCFFILSGSSSPPRRRGGWLCVRVVRGVGRSGAFALTDRGHLAGRGGRRGAGGGVDNVLFVVVVFAVGLGGAAYQGAVGGVDAAVGLRAVAGGDVGVLAVAVHVAGDGVLHDHIGPVRVCANYMHGDGVVYRVHAGLYLDRPLAVVGKAELGAAPADRGVQAGGQVADAEVVADAGVYLQVCQQRCVIEGAGDLADAAADLLHHLAAGVGARGLIAALRGALARSGW